MAVPLYQGVNSSTAGSWKDDYNTGLWYDKFFCRWMNDEWSIADNGKKAWIKAAAQKKIGDQKLLDAAAQRAAMLVRAIGGEHRCYATDWHFVTGLGRNHPLENGFAWHHTLGVPYLPGSSVKGMVRAWAGEWSEVELPVMNRIFGPHGEEAKKTAQVGSVIFFDALPTGPVKLAGDVMTPHYAPYYKQGNNTEAPGDWHDPTPIPFLTVAAGQIFLFCAAPRRPEDEQSRADCAQALEWLDEALKSLGAGAKTAVGYGRFVRREKEEKDLSEKLPAPLAATPVIADPILAEMEQDGYSSNQDMFMSYLTTKWLCRMRETEDKAEARKIAEYLKQWYVDNKPEYWKKPNKKNAPKIKEIKSCLAP